ncbi:hypothetical protein [Mycobacterium sp. IS-1742]|uniref:hypothetical protein n=1 Tax=Mycobacterium sp. IS-1742 TaxID=1772285 RepID=UPI000AD10F9B|nr:hypothetical protein [Mycobacterium sp. IS-1742]
MSSPIASCLPRPAEEPPRFPKLLGCASPHRPPADTGLSAENVACLIAGVPVHDEVCAQYIRSSPSPTGAVDPYGVVHGLSGAAPVWIVGGEEQK